MVIKLVMLSDTECNTFSWLQLLEQMWPKIRTISEDGSYIDLHFSLL
jgi:hypothetical protein